MAFTALVLRVLIASPGDTREERDAVERALHGWNADRAMREEVVLLPQRWDSHAVPRLGQRSQAIINEQLVDTADIVLALFDSRLGQATSEAVSGTAEEIERATNAGKPVHVWFSDEPLPRDVNTTQLNALRSFKKRLEKLGLLGTYASPEDLAFKARQAVESDLTQLDVGPIAAASHGRRRGAQLRARYDFDREPDIVNGRTRMRTKRERIVVENLGTEVAENVRLEVEPIGQGSAPHMWGDEAPTIIPNSSFSWPVISHMGVSRSVRITMTWFEGGKQRSETQDLAM